VKRADAEPIVRLTVRAKPRAKRSRVVRVEGLTLDVALAAPPVDGAANEELVETIANALSIAKRAVQLVRGETSRNKLVDVHGLTEEDVVLRLAALATTR
jgi:uncharacterized protein (TIGR00251 family)